MGWWKADPIPPSADAAQIPTKAYTVSPSPSSQPDPASSTSCPVDPKTRSIWLQQHSKPMSDSQYTPQQPPSLSSRRPITLSRDRVISTIPRANPTPTSPTPPQSSSTPPPCNSETATISDPSTGNWVYPSEHQFFTAIMRKHATPDTPTAQLATTIPAIIPIHNAVNERAWHLIKAWEGNTSQRCGGPRLASFRGLGSGESSSATTSSVLSNAPQTQHETETSSLLTSLKSYIPILDPRTSLTPRARFNAFLGYQAPFDRHDWVVERCDGTRVEYVIDFYQGRPDMNRQGPINFYLDVRPKLNSWEGWRMRARRVVGLDSAAEGWGREAKSDR